MLNFLAPAAFAGLLLLAIPIAVHLFKPRKMRQTPFSSLRWLKVTRQRAGRDAFAGISSSFSRCERRSSSFSCWHCPGRSGARTPTASTPIVSWWWT